MIQLCQWFRFLYFFRVDFLFSPCRILHGSSIKLFFCHVRLMAVLCNNLMASVCRCTRVCWISEQSPQIIRCPQIRFSLIWFSLNSFFVLHWRSTFCSFNPFCNITHLLSRCYLEKASLRYGATSSSFTMLLSPFLQVFRMEE